MVASICVWFSPEQDGCSSWNSWALLFLEINHPNSTQSLLSDDSGADSSGEFNEQHFTIAGKSLQAEVFSPSTKRQSLALTPPSLSASGNHRPKTPPLTHLQLGCDTKAVKILQELPRFPQEQRHCSKTSHHYQHYPAEGGQG